MRTQGILPRMTPAEQQAVVEAVTEQVVKNMRAEFKERIDIAAHVRIPQRQCRALARFDRQDERLLAIHADLQEVLRLGEQVGEIWRVLIAHGLAPQPMCEDGSDK